MSDARSKYSRMNSDQRLERLVSIDRELEDMRQHRAAIKRDLARAEALLPARLTWIDNELGAPVMRDLIWTLTDLLEAGSPLQSSPSEDTMRVTNPSSSRDEGAPTRRYRQLRKPARYRIERLTESLRNDLNRDDKSEHVSYVNRQNQLVRWHKKGKHGEPVDDCPECAEVAV